MSEEVPKRFGGFVLKKSKPFEDCEYSGYLYKHEKFGTEFLYIKTQDPENFFSVFFRTPQIDNTGVSHMLEHLTLRGSNKYPINNVFFELKKRSYATFMNAMTGSECTSFPFASTNQTDFLNCLDVYLDCVFHPKLTEADFLSECYHLSFEDDDPSKELKHGGVIYNEMSGEYSSPIKYFNHKFEEQLYPDSASRFDVGGLPWEIPKATWENLKKHHHTYYHPVNGFFLFYGCFDPAIVFNKVNEVIDPFDVIPSPYDASVFETKPWTEMKTVEIETPADTQLPIEEQYCLELAWLINEPVTNDYLMSDLDNLMDLIGVSNNSPLYKALVETGLCKAISSGINHNHLYPYLAIQAKGFKKEDTERVEQVIWDVLRQCQKDGFDMERFEAKMHNLFLSNKIGTETLGLILLLSSAGQWIHGADPTELLDFNKNAKISYENGKAEGFFQGLIQKYILDNKHCLSARLIPIANMQEKMIEEEKEKLQKLKESLTEEQIQKILSDSKLIEEEQNKPQPLHLLPQIKRADLSKTSFVKPPTYVNEDDHILTFINPTNGVTYINIMGYFPLDIPNLHLAPLMALALTQLGAGKWDEYQLSLYKERWFYSASLAIRSQTRFDGPADNLHMLLDITGVCLDEDLDKLVEVLQAQLTDVHWNNTSKLEIIKESIKRRLAQTIVMNANGFAKNVADSQVTDNQAFKEMVFGLNSALSCLELLSSPETTGETLSQTLQTLYHQIVPNCTFTTYISCSEKTREKAEAAAKEIISSTKTIEKVDYQPVNYAALLKEHFHNDKIFLNVQIPTAYTVVSLYGTPFTNVVESSRLSILSEIFTNDLVLPVMREKLGAYGGAAIYTQTTGIFSFASYREKSPIKTLEAIQDMIKNGSEVITDDAIEHACVNYLAELDKPEVLAKQGLSHAFSGITLEAAQARRDQYLSMNVEQLKETAKSLIDKHQYTVISTSTKTTEPPEGFDVINL